MRKNRTVQVRMTKDQHDRLLGNCKICGFHSLSAYIRHVAIEKDFTYHRKIDEIHARHFSNAE